MSATASERFRAEIQGLRALAVMMVLVYHVWPRAMPGGYAGVDVFFVISGYLITGLLLRELERAGSLSFRRFYLRRARRLLPASLVTLAAIVAVTWLAIPQLYWRETARHVVASSLYAENWMLYADAVNYLAVDAVPGPTQHFWSLSLEEQFYVGWPLVMLCLYAAGRGAGGRRRVALMLGLGAITAASLAWSIHVARATGGGGYFSTFTRVWELGLGGLLACGPRLINAGRRATAAIVVGLAGIAASGLILDGQTHFPGYAACLPVFATALVLAAGRAYDRSPLTRWLEWRPVQFVGDISYSLYLVHWPIVIFWRVRSGDDSLSALAGLAVIAASIALAAASRSLIEERFRHPGGRRRDWLFVAGAAGGTALCVAAVLAMRHHATVQNRLIAQTPGASVMLRPGPLAPIDSDFVPSLADVWGDMAEAYGQRCITNAGDATVKTCTYGPDSASLRIAVIGDSHAVHWFPAFRRFADFIDVQIVGIAKTSCPFSDTVVYQRKLKRRMPDCAEWSKAVVGYLEDQRFDLAVISFAPRSYVDGLETGKLAPHIETIAAGTRPLFAQLASTDTEVVVLRSTPWHPANVPECVSRTPSPHARCTKRPASSVRDGAAEVAARQLGIRIVDMTEFFCRDDICPPIIGGVFVYRDAHHLTATYARSLGQLLMHRLLDEAR